MGTAENDRHAGWAPRSPTLRRGVLVATLAALACSSSGRAEAAPPVRPTQKLVTLLASHAVRSAPNANAPTLRTLDARRPITGARTVLPVLDSAAGGWLRVRLPGRPNGATGWIRARATAVGVTRWHIVVERAGRRVLVYRAGRAVRTFRAVVGAPSTPTPAGAFFVEEAVRVAPENAGAPFALALSARSNVFQQFDGGPGQVALHGLAHLSGALGTAASHGCVRLAGSAMRWLVGRIGAGVPVTIAG